MFTLSIFLIFIIISLLNYKRLVNQYRVWRWSNKLALNHHERTFQKIYQNINGYHLSKNARQTTDALEYTYGEIKFIPFIALLSQAKVNKNTVFYDLGSGTGKAVLACSMVYNVKKSCGIEIFANLHNAALLVRQKLHEVINYEDAARHTQFINADFLDVDIQDATVIFINAAALIGEIWDKLNTKLNSLPSGVTIISASKKITAPSFKLLKTTHVEMSWAVTTAYVYSNELGI